MIMGSFACSALFGQCQALSDLLHDELGGCVVTPDDVPVCAQRGGPMQGRGGPMGGRGPPPPFQQPGPYGPPQGPYGMPQPVPFPQGQYAPGPGPRPPMNMGPRGPPGPRGPAQGRGFRQQGPMEHMHRPEMPMKQGRGGPGRGRGQAQAQGPQGPSFPPGPPPQQAPAPQAPPPVAPAPSAVVPGTDSNAQLTTAMLAAATPEAQKQVLPASISWPGVVHVRTSESEGRPCVPYVPPDSSVLLEANIAACAFCHSVGGAASCWTFVMPCWPK
jgi:hypothetical protein